jgi:predicted HicB family RNase H-like nuclease
MRTLYIPFDLLSSGYRKILQGAPMGLNDDISPTEIVNTFLSGVNAMNKQKEKKQTKKLKTARFIFKVSPQLKSKIQEHAESIDISASQYIIQLVQNDLKVDKKEYR